uniref:Uncharacterized protein n=1 Tax=Phocoena sinus TaxID=42100 RepID=A0A8C9EC13_PHOSS
MVKKEGGGKRQGRWSKADLLNTLKCGQFWWDVEGRKGRVFCLCVFVYTFPRILHSWDFFISLTLMSQTTKGCSTTCFFKKC